MIPTEAFHSKLYSRYPAFKKSKASVNNIMGFFTTYYTACSLEGLSSFGYYSIVAECPLEMDNWIKHTFNKLNMHSCLNRTEAKIKIEFKKN